MCPDRQILSLYIDGELPSPWKEKFETHLADCEDCRAGLARYGKVRLVLQADGADVPMDRQNRVWNKIGAGANLRAFPQRPKDTAEGRFWNRSVSLPFPAAAAAAAVFVLVGLFAIQGRQLPYNSAAVQETGIADAGFGAASGDTIPVSDMNDVLQYLSREDTSDSLILTLPETRSFSSAGEPTLVKAADYSRRSATR